MSFAILRQAPRSLRISSRIYGRVFIPTNNFNHPIHTSLQLCDNTTSQGVEGSFIKDILKKIGIGKYKYNKSRLRRSGYQLLICMDELVDHPNLMNEFKLDDTFYSYYLISELHVWMMMCRLSQDGEDGRLVKQSLCQALWENIETKSKKLGEAAISSARRENISAMGSHFNASMFNYDEGILCDDKTLAASVWRSFYDMQDVDPEILAKVVCYIRKQVAFLDEQDSRLLLRQGMVNFLGIDEETADKNKFNQKMKNVYE